MRTDDRLPKDCRVVLNAAEGLFEFARAALSDKCAGAAALEAEQFAARGVLGRAN